MSNELEEGLKLRFDFKKLRKVVENCETDVVPVAVQDADTKEVLIVAYANELALKTTLEEGVATFWSTSRNELWLKGRNSGDRLKIVEIRVNCEQNSLLYIVRPVRKGACHTSHHATGLPRASCYYRRLNLRDGESLSFVPGAE